MPKKNAHGDSGGRVGTLWNDEARYLYLQRGRAWSIVASAAVSRQLEWSWTPQRVELCFPRTPEPAWELCILSDHNGQPG